MLETARLRLVRLRVEDAAALLGGGEVPGWPAAGPTDSALVEASLVVAAARKGRPPGSFGSYQMVRKQDGRVVGTCAFLGPPDGEGALEVGAGAIPEERGRGYEGEALGELVAWALSQPGIRRITVTLYDD